jgi:hypothetical protein
MTEKVANWALETAAARGASYAEARLALRRPASPR